MRALIRRMRISAPPQLSYGLAAQRRPASALARQAAQTPTRKTTTSTSTSTSAISTRTETMVPGTRRGIGSKVAKRGSTKQHEPTTLQDLDVLSSVPVPSTSVDVCLADGFGLNSGITMADGDGALLVDGAAFSWRPWEAAVVGRGKFRLQNERGQFDVPAEAFGVFDVLWPRPDLLIIGTGRSIVSPSPELRRHIFSLGMRLEVLDTRNAASQFNMLASERGVQDVAAVLIPIGWREGVGAAD